MLMQNTALTPKGVRVYSELDVRDRGQGTWIRVAMQEVFCCGRGYVIFIVIKLSNKKILYIKMLIRKGGGDCR